MKRALSLAAKGKGRTSPNPMVGAVIVKDRQIVGEAYHRQSGESHAEILALHQAGPRARGAVLYVTLEPCCHTNKRTPPCVPLLIQSGLARICVAMVDPNPQVNGRGLQQLKQANIPVSVGVCEQAARHLNTVYAYWITTGRPLVTLKGAMTLDGKIATATGVSRWITGERARQDVHRLRNQMDAILVGVGTVIADDPELSARGTTMTNRRVGRQPVRVVLDSRLRIPSNAKVLQWVGEQPTILCTTTQAPPQRIARLRKRGIQVWVLPGQGGRVSLKACLSRLGKEGLTSVLIEGGGRVNAAAFQQGLVNQVRLYMTPKLLGGQDAIGLIGGQSPKTLNRAWPLADCQLKKLGNDWLVTGTIESRR
ncbi:bifunctional diaminohydroxyphosphoribosylaminopyrimidine deaminase/5-amino-6-(5-phosphoribosylamino)uracil reductase RibD [Candidatus Nitrospira neomarina]|uniref:Riboflavin biosynthesis protein RibD n=1 Tax=Candidatus Nitrospira neomarina TaxID=3020899 RepID=A0AA96K510_9BACT|nr:bifunctional diaminohydroxyphosphoribosylaminopyrimidine deaminase/5-amino-6-(5-phosphoribosylamino)uracil reductase RibD [Candidatus Nitrospira neomarina]WNM63929.1 bifunctional diaminohydroxyphosphoribosylaminopyrimidine deaminase/5-amino-6-(5-phosphoribosylamino)uracil reductase RibD [Candidatus Nitrospira neomarina]